MGSKQERNDALNSFAHPMMQSMLQTPLYAIRAEMNGAFMETLATAQKDWSDFLHRRIKEDVAVGRRLMQSKSVADMHQVYSEYLNDSFEQYKEQSTKVIERGQTMAEHMAEASDNEKSTRARH
jgi:uncharacterized protein YgfB (UPF0149 family)